MQSEYFYWLAWSKSQVCSPTSQFGLVTLTTCTPYPFPASCWGWGQLVVAVVLQLWAAESRQDGWGLGLWQARQWCMPHGCGMGMWEGWCGRGWMHGRCLGCNSPSARGLATASLCTWGPLFGGTHATACASLLLWVGPLCAEVNGACVLKWLVPHSCRSCCVCQWYLEASGATCRGHVPPSPSATAMWNPASALLYW